MIRININKNFIFILLGLILVFPGYYIGDNYISITDVLIPFVWIFYAVNHGDIRKMRMNYVNKGFYGYVFACFLSICFACAFNGMVLISAFLKMFRLVECLMLATIIKNIYFSWNYASSEKNQLIFKYILFWGSISAIIGIYLFLTQSMVFHPTQLMEFNGKVMRRAEGVYGDAQSFSYAMSIIFLISIVLFTNKQNRILCIIASITSFFAIVFSDTRAAFFAVVFALIAFGINKRVLEPKKFLFLVVSIVILMILYDKKGFFYRFINERIIKVIQAVLSFDFSAVSATSSHRIETWGRRFEQWCSNNFVQKIIGTGYKVNVSDVADNQFVYSFITTGIVGFLCVIAYWIRLISFTLENKLKNYLFDIQFAMLILSIVFCCLCDAMTLYRAMYLLTVIFTLYYIEVQTNPKTKR